MQHPKSGRHYFTPVLASVTRDITKAQTLFKRVPHSLASAFNIIYNAVQKSNTIDELLAETPRNRKSLRNVLLSSNRTKN